MELGQNACRDEILGDFENVSCWSKTMLLGKIRRKPCACCRGLTFSPIIMKLDQHVGVDEISYTFENGSCWVKNWVTRSNLRKLFVGSRGHIFSPIIMKLGQDVCLVKSWTSLKIGSFGILN